MQLHAQFFNKSAIKGEKPRQQYTVIDAAWYNKHQIALKENHAKGA